MRLSGHFGMEGSGGPERASQQRLAVFCISRAFHLMGNPLTKPAGQIVIASVMLIVAAFIFWKMDGEESFAIHELEEQKQQLIDFVGAKGGRLDPITSVEVDRLGQAKDFVFDIPLAGGSEVFVVASCDADCTDLDLAITDPSGEVVETDEDYDASPIVHFTRETDGDYKATVSMAACMHAPCVIAYQALQVLGIAGGVSSGGGGFGTCFAVSPNGDLMTAWHVVSDAKEILVNFSDGISYEAHVVKRSESNDLALLRIAQKSPVWLSFASASEPQVGQKVFTVGYPSPEFMGRESKYTDGSISALTGMRDEASKLQVSIPVQPGNSGGAVVTEWGEVVGVMIEVATATATGGTVPQNVNYATKGAIAASLLGIEGRQERVTSAKESIEKTRAATCMVSTSD